MTPDRPVTAPSPDALAHVITETGQAVLDAIRATPYGSVEVVLHQARAAQGCANAAGGRMPEAAIVQVVRTQKLKLDAPAD
jgi:hypothetical protein